MRVFIAGATGAVGIRLVSLLASTGHAVTGLTHTPGKCEALLQAGAEVAIADALDEAALSEAVIAARPEVVVHELTSLSGGLDLRAFDRTFAASNQLRTRGVDILLAAARRAGARRFVAQSYCGWPYARTGAQVKSEEDALDSEPPREQRRTLDAIRYLEQTVTRATDIEGIVLRYGAFYGPRTGVFDGPMIDQVMHRRIPLIGEADGWWSFLHVDDAAAATAIAMQRGARGIYNIVDDEPAPVREWLPALAAMLGARPPWRMPKWMARLVAGEHIVAMMTEGRAGSNKKARRELSWVPAYTSWRRGFVATLSEDA